VRIIARLCARAITAIGTRWTSSTTSQARRIHTQARVLSRTAMTQVVG
jgi:hypothetical protein